MSSKSAIVFVGWLVVFWKVDESSCFRFEGGAELELGVPTGKLCFEFVDEVVDGAFDEGVILRIVFHSFDFNGVGEFLLQGFPVSGVEFGVVEFAAFSGVTGNALEGHEEEGVLGGVGKFFADGFGDAGLFVGIEAGNEDVRRVPGDLVLGPALGNDAGFADEDAEVLGSAGNDDLREAEFAGDGESVGSASAEDAPNSVGNFAEAVVEDGGDDSFLHHLLHGVTTSTDGVEGNDFVAGLFKEVDGVHGALGEDTEIGHADDAFGGGLGDALLGLSHAPGSGSGVGENFAGEDVESEDVGDGEHHGDVFNSDER